MNIRTAPNMVVFPGDSPRRSRTTIVLVVLVLLALAAAAVVAVNLTRSDDGASVTKVGGTPASPGPTASPTPADPQAATKAAIQDAYRQSFDAFVAIASDPAGSPDDPQLSQHAIGNALAASQLTILKLRRAGQVYVGRVEVHPSVVELTADTATVVDCGIGDVAVVEVATGRVVTPTGPPVGAASTATYRLIKGVWMQNTFKDEKRTCAPAAS